MLEWLREDPYFHNLEVEFEGTARGGEGDVKSEVSFHTGPRKLTGLTLNGMPAPKPAFERLRAWVVAFKACDM
jgi:hypothetical protein